jgi:hypothetical protein
MASQGRAQTHPKAELATPFIALGQPLWGASLAADHRAMNLGADRLGAELFVT